MKLISQYWMNIIAAIGGVAIAALVIVIGGNLATLLSAQQTPTACNSATIPVCAMGVTSGDVQTKPMAVPQSLTKVATADAYLKGCTITQPAGVTVTLQDNQGSPIPIIPAVTFTVTTQTIFKWGDAPSPGSPMGAYRYWAPGGFSIIASGAGATFQCSWSQ